ncbi:MAG TPA: chemotaxis protein CheB [Stellaceae bacterium]|nr:chemotaxis protein CheB [Stellaceae bacterium]
MLDDDAAEGVGGSFPIVGIGMSAGGLEVATAFLKAMPPDSGMGFVFVQHLDPTRESMLTGLLGRETAMPVVSVEDGMRVEPNRVHVIVPAKTLVIEGGILRLVEPEQPRGQRHPIDEFFTSLAHDQKAHAIAIVLSGAGSNGSAGIQDIKQVGGMCIAQDPATAKFDSMPRHAIATGAVDFILPAEEMPAALRRYTQHSYISRARPEMAEGPGADGSSPGFDDVLTLLHARADHDFRQYKHNTLSRRIHRRMDLAQVEKLDDYLTRLAKDRDETAALVKDLLIHVTAFFRDREAWDALDRDVIAPLVDNAARGQAIRVWVPACSTGEEAYTIAMLLTERSAAANKDLTVKIFATDAMEQHLGAARKATFPGSMVESLPEERLARFFEKLDDNWYRVRPALRETVLFAPQNLLKDPPYSRMDLVSCRNLLIYLKPAAQDKVLSLAHFALREGGYLFLGNAETVGQRDHLFTSVSKRWRIYRRIGPARSTAIDFASWPTRDEPPGRSTVQPRPADVALKSLAERFGPASVLIDRNYRALHFHGLTEDYLTQPDGSPTLDLLALARDGLRLTIRNAVRRTLDEKSDVTLRAEIKHGARDESVLVTASPVGDGMVMVSFARDLKTAPRTSPQSPPVAGASPPGRDLEGELKDSREEMRVTIQQFEATNEELTAANEEVTSINEELQATNEELESSKEELQSLNEELSTVNAQLDRKIGELAATGDDLENLLISGEVATIFLDTEMRIKWFSPAIQTLFNLIDQDIGRPIGNFSQKFAGGKILEKVQAAIARLIKSEEEVSTEDGRHYLLRVLPYHTRDHRIAGAVATFIDITVLKNAQDKIAEARDYAEAIVETVRDPLLVLTADLRARSANPAFYATFGLDRSKIAGRLVYELGSGEWNIAPLRLLLEEMIPAQDQINDFEVELVLPPSDPRYFLLNARRIDGGGGRPELILLAMDDITERKTSTRHQEMLVGELSHRVQNMLTIVQSIAHQTRRHSATPAAFDEAFQGRLRALANANDAVIAGSWKSVRLGGIVERALAPFGEPGQVVLEDGLDVDLRPQASLSVAMILHEMATNAVKYGALSVPVGKVAVAWRIAADGPEQRVTLAWTESGGPSVAAPSHRGQGTRFIERSIAYELRGKATIRFEREGVCIELSFPLTPAIQPVGAAPPPPPQATA